MFLLSTDAYVEHGDADAHPMHIPRLPMLATLQATPDESEKSLIIDKNTGNS